VEKAANVSEDNQVVNKLANKRYAGLKPQKAGEPGHNPNGRPKGSKNRSTILRELADLMIEVDTLSGLKERVPADTAINMALMRKAMTGDVAAIKEYQDTLYGKVADKLEANVKQARGA